MRVIDSADADAARAAAAAVRGGSLVVLPTDTVYGVGADPRSPRAVDRLLTAKGRGRDKPSPVLVASAAQAEGLAREASDVAKALMDEFWPGALTLVLPSERLGWDLGETNGTIALRMPNHPVALELLKEAGPLAVSSANLSGRPPAATVGEAVEQLGEKVAVYLDGGRCLGGAPSTIVSFDGDLMRVLREGGIDRGELARFGDVA